MRHRSLISQAFEDLRIAPRRSVVSTVGIAMGVAVLMIIVGLGLGARDAVLKKIVEELPIDMIEVVPQSLDLGILKLEVGALFGHSGLTVEESIQLKSIEGVSAVYPKLEVTLPLGARGGARFFGKNLYTDLFITGVSPELLEGDVPTGFVAGEEVLPVVISEQMIELYNGQVASALGTPHLTDATLTGFEFEVVVGRSLMLGRKGSRTTGVERARIVGVSSFATSLGATVPIETARELMRRYGTPGKEVYSRIIVKVGEPSDVPEVVSSIERLGFRVDKRAARARDILGTLILLGASLALLILALAGLNITHSFFAQLSERKREFAIMRAVGATSGDIMVLVLAQAALLGVAGGLCGALGARGAVLILDALALGLLPDFPFRPDSFFLLPGWVDGGAFCAAVGAATLGALWPAYTAGKAPIVRLFAEF